MKPSYDEDDSGRGVGLVFNGRMSLFDSSSDDMAMILDLVVVARY